MIIVDVQILVMLSITRVGKGLIFTVRHHSTVSVYMTVRGRVRDILISHIGAGWLRPVHYMLCGMCYMFTHRQGQPDDIAE